MRALCGRFVGVEHFNPRFFEDDLYGVEVWGLGKGRGFKVTDRYSARWCSDDCVRTNKSGGGARGCFWK